MCVYFFFNAYFYLFLHFKYLEILCIFPTYWNKKNYKDIIYVCVCTYIEELHWKVFFSPNDLKLFWFYPWTKSFQWPFWNWEALTSWNDFFFFFKKKAWRLIEERPTIFLFLRNHNKNFGWKLCLIPLDSVN